MKILPAVLTDSREDLEHKIRTAEVFADTVQIDVMDGLFVPSRSTSWEDLASIKTTLNLEVHLMVKSPEDYIEPFVRAGASRIVFHYEAAPDPEKIIRQIKRLGKKAGLALNPETSNQPLKKLAPLLDFALYLSVNPGFYGSPFIPEVLDKIREFKAMKISLELGIDGGIKAGNLKQIVETGVDNVCVGSAIFNQSNPGKSYLDLGKLAEDAGRPA
ncbi:MAG: ribulose-phosphate 3-epimerase [Dehalococcoidia bacterium]|nr:ribulose-phosphate 3-epimerase [Dehalococcoidia bacterium]